MKYLVLGLVLAASISATSPSGRAVIPHLTLEGKTVRIETIPSAETVFPNGTRLSSEINYWTPVGFRPLAMDVYRPPRTVSLPTRGFPVVMYIHGGGWAAGDRRHNEPIADFPDVLSQLASRGYVVASVDYRLSGEAAWPAQAQDVKAAIIYLRLHAADYGIDPERFVTWGASAGGHLAAIAATTCGVPELRPRQSGGADSPPDTSDPIASSRVSDCVQGAVAWYGVFDIATEIAQARRTGPMSPDARTAFEWMLLGCFKDQCPPGRIKSASPISYVTRGTPPMLLLTGERDGIVPYSQSIQMAEALDRAGVKHQIHTYPDMDHVFLGSTPAATREANQDALERTIHFIDATIGTP